MKKSQGYFLTLIGLSLSIAVGTTYADDQTPPDSGGHGHHPPRLSLTDEQKTCLQGKVGKPGQGERPSREKMQAAMKACNIQPPARPSGRPQSTQDGQGTQGE